MKILTMHFGVRFQRQMFIITGNFSTKYKNFPHIQICRLLKVLPLKKTGEKNYTQIE